MADLYRGVLAAEQTQSSTPDAIAAGTAALQAELERAGTTYDEFVWSLAAADEQDGSEVR